MKVKELINKLKKLDEESEVFLDGGFAINVLEASTVIYDRERDMVIICVDDVEDDDLKGVDCKII